MVKQDAEGIKKSILLRYPWTFLEECSRQLIIYKAFRGNNKKMRSMSVMDELIDYVTLDTHSGLRVYDLKDHSPKQLIMVSKGLVDEFRYYYWGREKVLPSWWKQEWTDQQTFDLLNGGYRDDGIPGIYYLSPGETAVPTNNLVIIRKPVLLSLAWGNRDPRDVEDAFSQRHEITNRDGGISIESLPLIKKEEMKNPSILVDSIPWSVFTHYVDSGWTKAAPICTLIEKTIAKVLEDNGYEEDEDRRDKLIVEVNRTAEDDTGDLML